MKHLSNTGYRLMLKGFILITQYNYVGEKRILKSFISSRDRSVKSRQGRDEKNARTLPYYRKMVAPSLASNAMHLHP